MIPLDDETRRSAHVPIVTVAIIATNVVIFLLELVYGDAFVLRWAVVPRDVAHGHHLETVLTAMFMHASWSHIIGNMIFFWAFGPVMEESMGRAGYLVFYLLGGTVAFLAQIFLDPGSTVPNLGASGAIAAVMGGFMVTFPRDRIRTILFFGFFARVTFIPAALLIGLWFLSQLIDMGVIASSNTGGVAYMAHIGGLIFGVATARLFEWPHRDSADYDN